MWNGTTLFAVLALFTGCTTTPKVVPNPAQGLSRDIRPTDTPPFFSFLDSMLPWWGPSRSFKQAQKAFRALCVKDDLLNREKATAAVDLLDRALTLPDIKPQEREALKKQYALAQ